MKPIKYTAAILAYKSLNRDIDKTCIDWAVDMLMEGFDTEHLVILSGISPPYEQFELQKIADKALEELQLDYSDRDQIIKDYINYLSKEALNNQIEPLYALRLIRDIYLELDHEKSLQQFYLLYYAKYDLLDSENQWYIDGIDRSNIDSKIIEHFIEFAKHYENKL
ncbi:hypothetical protein [Pedobacter polysacchareus]|uniref:hypothetical protein n=1 Tax=Pedobacter polysacchareus TaxID=2861973 RepID=UPI001C990BD7|nr:hypothetical protein [Pedobacter polysacchareus]